MIPKVRPIRTIESKLNCSCIGRKMYAECSIKTLMKTTNTRSGVLIVCQRERMWAEKSASSFCRILKTSWVGQKGRALVRRLWRLGRVLRYLESALVQIPVRRFKTLGCGDGCRSNRRFIVSKWRSEKVWRNRWLAKHACSV